MLIYAGMSVPLARMVALVCAVLVLGTAATASARPKKQSVERTTTSATTCDGTPIIMQGMDCPRRHARGEDPEQKQPTPRAAATIGVCQHHAALPLAGIRELPPHHSQIYAAEILQQTC